MAKTALIIQCDIVAKKCVGYACMKSFETRTGKFAGLEEGVNYLSTTCGGCCGMGVAAKLVFQQPAEAAAEWALRQSWKI